MKVVPPTEIDAALFDPEGPNHPVCAALLSGEGVGRAVTDGTHALLHADFEFTFASRNADAAFLDGAIPLLRPEYSMALVTRDAEPTSTLPRSQLVDRVEYCGHRPIAAPALPDGYELRPLDAALIERCLWKGVVLAACGTIDRFLEVGIGWCAMHGDEIASESYAVYRSATHYEIGVVTARRHRGRGLVVPTCTRLVEQCSEAGYGVYWSCHCSNLASQRTAQKLGFEQQRPYQYFCY